MNAKFFLIASFVLFAISIYFYRKTSLPRIIRLVFSLLALSSICLNVAFVASDYFTANGIGGSGLFRFLCGFGGAGFSEYWGLISLSVLFLAFTFGFLVWTFMARSANSTARRAYVYAAFIPALLSPMVSPATADLYRLFAMQEVETSEEEFYEYYRKPTIEPKGENKNLVFIFAESLERTYFDEKLFPGLVKGLRGLESGGTSFTNIDTAHGTGWTIGGIVGSLCGIPLVTPSHGNSMVGMDEFLPSAVCLTDLLDRQGYHLAYYGGADLDFAGKGKFFKTHGFGEVRGRNELLAELQDRSYTSGWGLYDDTLFDIAFNRFVRLSEEKDRFALFMLTLDTHHPYGHPSPVGCNGVSYGDGSNPILNAVACSDHLITRLVEKIRRSPYGADTVVVVVSDHLAMRNTATDILKNGDRKNLFMVIGPGSKGDKIDRAGSTLDVGATVLPFIGYRGELGLGRDLRSGTGTKQETGYILKQLSSWGPYLASFWNFPRITGDVEINFSKVSIGIGGRTFGMPILVELDENLDTTLKFGIYTEEGHKKLFEHVQTLDADKGFLWIDMCSNASRLNPVFGEYGACVVAGRNGEYWDLGRILPIVTDSSAENNQVLRLSPDDIRYFTGFGSGFKVRRIAHAGGGVMGMTYTDSYDALNENIKKGFEYFELDFNFTSDGHLVCIHDWQGSFKQSFGLETDERPTLEGFKALVKTRSKFQNCTLDGLVDWLERNPSAKIVTDIKDDNLRALEIMAKVIPDFGRRVIPQIYFPEDYARVRGMGYEQIIWTLYLYGGSNADVLQWVDRFKGPFAVTMPRNRAVTNLPAELARRHVPTYAHTINTPGEANSLKYGFGVADIYTDFLSVN